MFEFIKSVFIFSGILGTIAIIICLGVLLSGLGIRWFSASVVWVLGMFCKLTGGKL